LRDGNARLLGTDNGDRDGIIVMNGCPLSELQISHRNVRLWSELPGSAGLIWTHKSPFPVLFRVPNFRHSFIGPRSTLSAAGIAKIGDLAAVPEKYHEWRVSDGPAIRGTSGIGPAASDPDR